jgi:high-affinity K+ transport system ATPase subunit B
MNILIFVFAVFLMTPSMLAEYVNATGEATGVTLGPTIQTYIQTGSTVVFNVILIPALIDLSTQIEGFKTESARQMAVMNRCFFFMIVFTLFMPLMGLSTMKSFFAEINATSMVDWPSMVSKNMLN